MINEPYTSLNDAAERHDLPDLAMGNTQIWYDRNPTFMEDNIPTLATLKTTHAWVGSIACMDLERIYALMQGENWSPNGEARDVIRVRGLRHTSMSIGDVVKIGNEAWMVSFAGFRPLK